MTLKEAQKKWDDAIQMKLTHKPYAVTKEFLVMAINRSSKEPVKPLFMKIGKTSSQIIYSVNAAKEEERQKSLLPGTKVRMTGAEAIWEHLEDTVFTVVDGPQWMCEHWVVWLDKYSGAYWCKCLEKID